MSLLWSFVQPYLWRALAVLAAIGTVVAVVARIKHAGRLQERVETQARTLESVKRRQEVEHEVREDLRRTGDSAVDRLREQWSRD